MTAQPGSAVPAAHVEPFRVRFDECGADGSARTSTYLRWMQDAASVHSSNAGYTRAWYRDHGIFWVVRFLDLRILAPSGPGDVLAVSTEVTGFRRIWARRHSEFRAGGALTAEADVDWVLTTAAGRPTRVPAEIVDRFPASIAGYAPGRLELPEPPADAREISRRSERHELDPMAHVNNAAYIDQFEAGLDEVGAGAIATALPRRYRIEYVVPAAAGVSLRWQLWPFGGAWAGRLRDDRDNKLLSAAAESG